MIHYPKCTCCISKQKVVARIESPLRDLLFRTKPLFNPNGKIELIQRLFVYVSSKSCIRLCSEEIYFTKYLDFNWKKYLEIIPNLTKFHEFIKVFFKTNYNIDSRPKTLDLELYKDKYSRVGVWIGIFKVILNSNNCCMLEIACQFQQGVLEFFKILP